MYRKIPLALMLIFLGLTTAACQQKISEEAIVLLNPEEYKQAIAEKNIQLVDIRTLKEYKGGYIKNAKNIDFYAKDFVQQMSVLDKKKPVYIYCHSGGRSNRASYRLIKAGFSKVVDLKGGITAWKNKQLPLNY